MNTKLEKQPEDPKFFNFLEDIFHIAMARNDSMIAAKSVTKEVKLPLTLIYKPTSTINTSTNNNTSLSV